MKMKTSRQTLKKKAAWHISLRICLWQQRLADRLGLWERGLPAGRKKLYLGLFCMVFTVALLMSIKAGERTKAAVAAKPPESVLPPLFMDTLDRDTMLNLNN